MQKIYLDHFYDQPGQNKLSEKKFQRNYAQYANYVTLPYGNNGHAGNKIIRHQSVVQYKFIKCYACIRPK